MGWAGRRRLRRVARAALATLAVVLLALAGSVLGLRLAGPSTYATPLGDIRIAVDPALRGEIDAYVPIADWGVRSHAFTAPLRLRGEIRSVERGGVLRAATGERKVVERTREAVDDAAAAALVRASSFSLGGALAVGLVAALALLAAGRRGRGPLLLSTVGTVAAAAALAGTSAVLARATFDPDALQRPSFYARGAELLQLLDAADKSQERAARYRASAESGVRSFSRLLAEGGIGADGFLRQGGDSGKAMLASDLHNNTLAVDALEALAEDDRPIFFVGDFGHQGSEAEARLVAPRLARLGSPVIAVSGNHDSSLLMRRLVGADVTVLTGGGRLRADGSVTGPPVIEVMGAKVAGVSDPLEWQGTNPTDPERIFGFSELDDGDAAAQAARDRLVRWFDGLPERPHIVLVHQNGLAQHLARTLHDRGRQPPLLILTGHDHKQHVDRHGNVVVADAGTVGAGGIFGVGSQEIGLGELHFSGGGALAAIDLIKAEPLVGGAKAQRVIVDGRRCADEAEECRLSD